MSLFAGLEPEPGPPDASIFNCPACGATHFQVELPEGSVLFDSRNNNRTETCWRCKQPITPKPRNTRA